VRFSRRQSSTAADKVDHPATDADAVKVAGGIEAIDQLNLKDHWA
jgi:hypothetical protein